MQSKVAPPPHPVSPDTPHSNYWSGPDKGSKILRRLTSDVAAALLAALSTAPIMLAVDKAVVEKASGNVSMMGSIKNTGFSLLKNPIKFVASREFLWIFGVYAATYSTANSIDSLCKINKTSDVVPKLVGITAVNMTMSILKDRAFAYYFGRKVTNKVGAVSLGLWLVRDVLTMAAAFVIPSRVAHVFASAGVPEESAEKVSIFSCPIIFQVFLTPFHLLGYDFYNFKDRTMGQRITYLKSVYPSVLGLRMIRMAGAYGIGGVNNRSFRNYFNSKLEGPAWDHSY